MLIGTLSYLYLYSISILSYLSDSLKVTARVLLGIFIIIFFWWGGGGGGVRNGDDGALPFSFVPILSHQGCLQ